MSQRGRLAAEGEIVQQSRISLVHLFFYQHQWQTGCEQSNMCVQSFFMVYICWCLLKYPWVYMHTSDPAIQGRSRVLESERGFSEISSHSGSQNMEYAHSHTAKSSIQNQLICVRRYLGLHFIESVVENISRRQNCSRNNRVSLGQHEWVQPECQNALSSGRYLYRGDQKIDVFLFNSSFLRKCLTQTSGFFVAFYQELQP